MFWIVFVGQILCRMLYHNINVFFVAAWAFCTSHQIPSHRIQYNYTLGRQKSQDSLFTFIILFMLYAKSKSTWFCRFSFLIYVGISFYLYLHHFIYLVSFILKGKNALQKFYATWYLSKVGAFKSVSFMTTLRNRKHLSVDECFLEY